MSAKKNRGHLGSRTLLICIKSLNSRVAWLLNTVQHCNPKLRINPQLKHVALGAITRIDLSFNALTHLPHELFTQLCSLRTLNVARNRLQKLPHGNSAASGAPAMRYDCPQLEELYLQDNQLEEVPAAVFALPALVTLDVSNNKLQALPYAMWTAFKLRDLNVAFNLLKDLPFCTSVSLEFLVLMEAFEIRISEFSASECERNCWRRGELVPGAESLA